MIKGTYENAKKETGKVGKERSGKGYGNRRGMEADRQRRQNGLIGHSHCKFSFIHACLHSFTSILVFPSYSSVFKAVYWVMMTYRKNSSRYLLYIT